MTNQPYAACLPFNVLHPRNPCNYMDYYSFTDPGDERLSWPGWLTIADTLPTKLYDCYYVFYVFYSTCIYM